MVSEGARPWGWGRSGDCESPRCSEIPRPRNLSTEEFLGSGVRAHPHGGEHPRQGRFLASPISSRDRTNSWKLRAPPIAIADC